MHTLVYLYDWMRGVKLQVKFFCRRAEQKPARGPPRTDLAFVCWGEEDGVQSIACDRIGSANEANSVRI